MGRDFEPVIGIEVHAVLETRSKMFCGCAVVDSTQSAPNTAVCPVCAGMPGVLPVINKGAVEYAVRVALALECEIATTSIFARKSYFYPDLPKGYQISQYEQPLARDGRLWVDTEDGGWAVRIRRVHLEEDTGKLVHVHKEGESYSLVDLNRAGLPLLEIVTEPDMHSPEEARAYAFELRSLLRYLGVNSGDLEKGLFRIEPNISLREVGSSELGTRTEIKNLNSFRSLERALTYEIKRQGEMLQRGEAVVQETIGWDEEQQVIVTQRSKEDAEDYRYYPEPDLPPLVLAPGWIEEIRATLPELPQERRVRFQQEYGLSAYDAGVLVAEKPVADFYEAVLAVAEAGSPKVVANWISGELFGLMKQMGVDLDGLQLTAESFGELLKMVARDEINQNTGKDVLAEMLSSGKSAAEIVAARGLRQISDLEVIAKLVNQVLEENPEQVVDYLAGKEVLARWLFGQVMRAAKGRANPQVVQAELARQLASRRTGDG